MEKANLFPVSFSSLIYLYIANFILKFLPSLFLGFIKWKIGYISLVTQSFLDLADTHHKGEGRDGVFPNCISEK